MRRGMIALGVLTLQITAYLNSFVTNLKGATEDAVNFHETGIEWAHSGELRLAFDAEFFSQFVGIIYRYTFQSEFWFAQLNIIFLLVGLTYVRKTATLLGVRIPAIFYFLMLVTPSLLPRATTVLREPLLIALLSLTAYSGAKFAETRGTRLVIVGALAMAGGALVHKAFAVAFVLIGTLLVVTSTHNTSGSPSVAIRLRKAVLIIAVLGVALIASRYWGGQRGLQPVTSILSGDLSYIDQVLDYKSNLDARTTYGARLETSSLPEFLASIPRNWLYYNFAPFPWRANNGADLLAALESTLRLTILLYLAITWTQLDRRVKTSLFPVLVVHFGMMVIWAGGTANYGTASRHNLTTNWFFALYFTVAYATRKANHERHRRLGGGNTQSRYYLAPTKLSQ